MTYFALPPRRMVVRLEIRMFSLILMINIVAHFGGWENWEY